MKRTEKLMQFKDALEQLDEQMKENRMLTESLVDAMEVENYRVITSSLDSTDEEEVKQDVEDVNLIHKATRKIGQRFFNLFKVTFTVEFAGVRLIHWTIPRIDDNGNAVNINVNKNNKS